MAKFSLFSLVEKGFSQRRGHDYDIKREKHMDIQHWIEENMARETNDKIISISLGDVLRALKNPLLPFSIEYKGCDMPEIQLHPFSMLFLAHMSNSSSKHLIFN